AFAEAASAAPAAAPVAAAPPLEEAAPPPAPFARGLFAAARVAREIASDLFARKLGYVALAGAALVLAATLLLVRNQVVQGLAATARQLRSGGLFDDERLAQVVGRGAAAG